MLIGVLVAVHLYINHVDVYDKGRLVERSERIRGRHDARAGYHNVIGSLE